MKFFKGSSIIGSLIFSIIFPLLTVFYAISFRFYKFFNKKHLSKLPMLWGKHCLLLLRLLTGIKIKYHNFTNNFVPDNLSGQIIASEHQSALEIIALIAIIPNAIFILKKELLSVPFLGRSLKELGMIGIDRKSYNPRWMEEAEIQLKEGKNIIIFPEGTRVQAGKEVAYKNGAFKLAKHLNKQIIPVAINTGLFWPRRSIIKKPGTANIIFGKCIDPEPSLLRLTYKQLREII